MILHAGDVLVAELLDELRELAPVHAVLGNNDHSLVGTLPETLEVELGGRRGRTGPRQRADQGPSRALLRRVSAQQGRRVRPQPSARRRDSVVDDQRLFNPGSPTQRRRAPTRTMGWLELRAGEVVHHEIVDV